MTGEEALAWGAWAAGVRFVTGYPGTPSKGLFVALQRLKASRPAFRQPLVFHWAPNEKIALEMALGATLAGWPALVCVKSVGANVLLDALMTANLSGVPAPLVIALGDDPSAWTSQNEQDSRWLALMAEVPLLEPLGVEEAPGLMREAFRLSAEFALPVIVRFPKAFAQAQGELREASGPLSPVSWPERPSLPSIASGGNALRLHAELHRKMKAIAEAWKDSPLNRLRGRGPMALLAVGFCATKVREVEERLGLRLEALPLLALATSSPLPHRWLAEALQGVGRLLVVEEGEPIVETLLRSWAQREGWPGQVEGKGTGALPQEGELTLRSIGRALGRFVDIPEEALEALPDPQRPQGLALRFCEDCPYPPLLEALITVCRTSGMEPVVAADPGCAVVAAGPPYEVVRIKHSMGGSVNFIAALAKLEGSPRRRYIALVGDSDFFHGALLGILNAAHWRAPMALFVVDNGGAAFTGGQPHLGSGFDAEGHPTPPLSIEALLRAAGIPTQVVASQDVQELRRAIAWALEAQEGPRAVVYREPCPFVPLWTPEGLKPRKTEGKIVGE